MFRPFAGAINDLREPSAQGSPDIDFGEPKIMETFTFAHYFNGR
jgi:hypothetical protein